MTTHDSRKCSDSQERDSGAQHQEGCAAPDQAHRDKWPWPELKTVLQLLQTLLAAATLFAHVELSSSSFSSSQEIPAQNAVLRSTCEPGLSHPLRQQRRDSR